MIVMFLKIFQMILMTITHLDRQPSDWIPSGKTVICQIKKYLEKNDCDELNEVFRTDYNERN